MSAMPPLPETDQAPEPANPEDDAEAHQKGAQNAFTALMSGQRQQQQASPPPRRKAPNVFKNRDGLGAYLDKPESFPSSVVAYYNDDFVAVHDMYPKSSVHLLLLPRDPARFFEHPFVALEDPEFLTKVRVEARKLRKLAAAELRRKYGRFSASEKERRDAMEADPPPEELPKGRDWEGEIMCGIHAHPSMNHLHIHVISTDRYSVRSKHRKHYNSFATPFFVNLDDLPLAPDDVRRHPGREGYLQRDLVCWRCGANFGNKFSQLKVHLEQEFEKWKSL